MGASENKVVENGITTHLGGPRLKRSSMFADDASSFLLAKPANGASFLL